MSQQETLPLHSPSVWIPENIETAWKIKKELGEESCFVAGGTLLLTQWNKSGTRPSHFISLENITELQGNHYAKSQITIGALTTIHACRYQPTIINKIPLIGQAACHIAAPAVRNRATIGGNIAGGNGDMIPALLVLDASITLYDGVKRKPKFLWDHIRNQENDFGSLLISIMVPEEKNKEETVSFFQKISQREAFAPSLVTVSGLFRLNKEKEVSHIRLAAGGADIVPLRLVRSEEALKENLIKANGWEKMQRIIAEELSMNTAEMAAADYKCLVAANVMVSKLAALIIKG